MSLHHYCIWSRDLTSLLSCLEFCTNLDDERRDRDLNPRALNAFLPKMRQSISHLYLPLKLGWLATRSIYHFAPDPCALSPTPACGDEQVKLLIYQNSSIDKVPLRVEKIQPWWMMFLHVFRLNFFPWSHCWITNLLILWWILHFSVSWLNHMPGILIPKDLASISIVYVWPGKRELTAHHRTLKKK